MESVVQKTEALRSLRAIVCPVVYLLSVLAAANTSAAEFFVNPLMCDDAFTGLCSEPQGGACGPMRTIRTAMDASANGDTITLADGIYSGDGNQALWFNGKLITIRSANGPASCVIDPELTHRLFRVEYGERRDAIIAGCCIRRSPT